MKQYVLRFLGWLLFICYKLWCKTLHYTEMNRQPVDDLVAGGQPVVLCLWHDELFPLIFLKKHLNIIAVVSHSQDGSILANLLEHMGLETARGSSSRGGLHALLLMARRMQHAKINSCITLDGPRGPRHETKEGAIFLALKTGAPLVPIRLFMSQTKVFKSWDRFQLPLPFSAIRMVCAAPYHPVGNISNSQSLKLAAQELTNQLEQLGIIHEHS